MVKKASRAAAKPTLATVAKAVGVSPMSVSNAYNKPDRLSPELRERILAKAEELGYPGPNPTARSLRRAHSGVLGAVLGESLTYAFDDPGALEFLHGLAEACSAHSAGLQLVPASGTDADVRLIQGASVDAFVLFGLPDDHQLVETSLRRGLPVLTSGGPELPNRPFVGIDDRSAAHAAAEYLLALGHRNVAVISLQLHGRRGSRGPASVRAQMQSTFRVARERLAGYRKACEAAGLDWGHIPVYEVASNTWREGHHATLELMRAASPVTAVLAMSDELAFGTLKAAEELRIDVPADLSIIGWDRNPRVAGRQPVLTTVEQPLRDQGRLLGEMALSQTANEQHVMMPWKLVEGATTLSPRATGRDRVDATASARRDRRSS
ncbi:LacI family DNA-binding transcriptional regulator [Streptomyces canus]|uniref:LacI family DNA-binding transcriptional regulator n=1 Tax=Streptomyces canus TaxID=58343 RepID=UPI0033E5808A